LTLKYVGPVALTQHYDPSFSWGAEVGTTGARSATISGRLDWGEAWSIHELVANPDRRVSFAGLTGVLELVWSDDELQRPFNGWYLLQSCTIDPAQKDSLGDIVPCSIGGVHLGSRRVVLSRFARALPNDFGISTIVSLLAAPLWNEIDNEALEITPGGSSFTREYDDRTVYDASELEHDSRNMIIYAGAVT
jgi:hypothetical protein